MNFGFRSASRLKRRLTIAVAASALIAIPLASHAAESVPADANRAASDAVVDQAEQLIRRAGQSDPADSDLIHQAMDKLKEAQRIDPRNDSAYVDMGFCDGVLRDAPDAINNYRTAVQLNPSGDNFIELADIYLRVGDSEDALAAANAGIEKDPRNARLYNAKGMALNDLQRFGEAEEAWEKALRLNPNLKVARANLDALNGGPNGRGSIAKHSSQSQYNPQQ